MLRSAEHVRTLEAVEPGIKVAGAVLPVRGIASDWTGYAQGHGKASSPFGRQWMPRSTSSVLGISLGSNPPIAVAPQ
jgi:hypothetical protein